jgi:CRP-like cAMP-binding protein
MEPTVLCLMRADDFRRIAREESEVSLKVAQRLCQRTAEIEQVFSETVFKTVRSRVASGLLRAYRRNPKTDGSALRLTHQEIASLIGSTRETTTAVLHGLRKQGILSLSNRRLIVLDPVGLEHAAGGR